MYKNPVYMVKKYQLVLFNLHFLHLFIVVVLAVRININSFTFIRP